VPACPRCGAIDADLGFMHDRRADDGDGFAALLAASTSLRAVHLRGRDNAPHALFDAVAASRLEEFELSLCDHRATFDALDAAALARMMARCETLTSLNVDGWHVHDFGQLFAALQLNTTLLQLEWGVSDDDDDDDDDGESRVVDHRRRDAVCASAATQRQHSMGKLPSTIERRRAGIGGARLAAAGAAGDCEPIAARCCVERARAENQRDRAGPEAEAREEKEKKVMAE
jgi:hypothetical protein